MVGADAVAQMQVCGESDSQMVQFAAGFFNPCLVVIYIEPVFMDDSVGTQTYDKAGGGTAAQDKGCLLYTSRCV